MSIEVKYKEKLSKVLFITLKEERIKRIFNMEISGELYIPIRSSLLANDEKLIETGEIPLSVLFEGMFYILGADPSFKYCEKYKEILLKNENGIKFIKGKIFSLIDCKNYEEAYILLRGLASLYKDQNLQEIHEKMILLLNTLKTLDSDYEVELLRVLDEAKSQGDSPTPYIYEAIHLYEKKNYDKAYYRINEYFSLGGEKTKEALDLFDSIKIGKDYKKGTELLEVDPKESLELLLPLLNILGNDPSLYYYIGIAYRNLKMPDQAIHYQGEALKIDSHMIQSINEIGINYATLGNFQEGIKYLRDAFETTKSIEICTNLIMCYMSSKDIENAKLHIKIGEKIDKDDEILGELRGMLGE